MLISQSRFNVANDNPQAILERIARLHRDRRKQYRDGRHHAAAEIEDEIKVLEEQLK